MGFRVNDGRWLWWDDEALHLNLIDMDARAVKQIALGRARDDFWAWAAEKNGMYSVRSVYRLLSERAAQFGDYGTSRASHSMSNNDPQWKNLWKIKVPPKVRVFWWRVSNDYMPSRANLHRRHIEPGEICETCGATTETTFHALIECTYSMRHYSGAS
jgi:hypothetical protein